jgi:ribosomal protein S18 acetylase RimI-like enzyme
MTINIKLIEPPFSDEFICDFLRCTKAIFPNENDEWYESRKWRLLSMPDMSCFVAYKEESMIGYKVGYATTYNIYYSWLGGVDPKYRRQGIATQLSQKQNEWLLTTRFKTVETHVEQDNKAMIIINQKCGLDIVGLYLSNLDPYFIMRKKIEK